MRADTTDPESAVVYLGIKASQTGRLYVPVSAPPYTPAVYGPLLHLSVAGLAVLEHGSHVAIQHTGRILAFVSFLLIGGVIYAAARRLGSSRGIAALGALGFVSNVDAVGFNVSVRQICRLGCLRPYQCSSCCAETSRAIWH